ncbi:hypothetical protein BASA62_002377 [Batrachochytrium salamandrivorans]|nr:hypothetical protein BASA62_002377 [Batrachochytrium salamandrivorans]
MRVGIGIILSVLSSSVLAAVIPDYDSHGLLLVRRAVNPENRVLLWKRAGEDQEAPGPSSSGAGAGNDGSSPSLSSGNLDGLKKNQNTPEQKSIQKRDGASIKKTMKKVTGVIKGVQAGQSIAVIEQFLTIVLESARATFGLLDNRATVLFFYLSISASKDQQSLTKAVVKIQNRAKRTAERHLENIVRSISNITKQPRNVLVEMQSIINSVTTIHSLFRKMYDGDYMALASKVKNTANRKYIKDTGTYITALKASQGALMDGLKFIESKIKVGVVKIKRTTSEKFANFKSQTKSRLGFKSKSSAGITSKQEATDGDTPGQGSSNQEESAEKPSGQDESNQEPPDEKPSDQAKARPTPAPRLSKLNRQATIV